MTPADRARLRRELAQDRCRVCRKRLSLTGTTRAAVGFRCHVCGGLFCDAHARRHFGDLTGFTVARALAFDLWTALADWIVTPAEHGWVTDAEVLARAKRAERMVRRHARDEGCERKAERRR